jgi:hypothetical protein
MQAVGMRHASFGVLWGLYVDCYIYAVSSLLVPSRVFEGDVCGGMAREDKMNAKCGLIRVLLVAYK